MKRRTSAAGRERLANRRILRTVPLRWDRYELEVTVGFHECGMVREIFVSNTKVGSEIEGLLQDAMISISILLQCHHPLASLAHSVGRHEHAGKGDALGPPTSILGRIIDCAADVEAQCKPEIAKAYALQAEIRRRQGPTVDEGLL